VMFVDYLAYLRGDMSPLERWTIGAGVISAMTWMNIRGIRLVGLTSMIFTLLVVAPFAVLVVLGAPQVQPSVWLNRTGAIDWAVLLSVLLWNTSGWDNAGCCAGEVKNPQRTYPRAMAFTVLFVTLAYLLPVAVGVGVESNWSSWKEGYFPIVAARIGGSWLGIWLTVAGLISAAAMLSALLCTSARVPYAMAERGMLPQRLATLHPRYATPWISIMVNSVGLAVLIPFSFQDLIEIDMFLYAAALVLEFAALIWLRVKKPEMPRPYRVPYGLAGVITLSFPPVVLCLASIALSNDATRYVSLGGIAAGLIVYWWRCRLSAARETEPAATV
jgi:amino acid transporter